MKNLIPYAFIALLVTVVIWLWNKPAPIQQPTIVYKDTPVKEEEFTDSDGNKHSTYDNTSGIVSRTDIRNPGIPLGIIDTSAKALGIARSQIMFVNKIASLTKDSLLRAKWEINQLKKKILRYQDQFVDLSYTPDSDSTKTGVFSFEYNNEVTVTQYQQRKKVLGLPIGAKRSYIDISSNDPRTKINGLKSLSVEQKQPSFGLRGQATANINPETGSYGIGPALRIDLGRFSFQGNYVWYPESNRWRPSINANYDLVRF